MQPTHRLWSRVALWKNARTGSFGRAVCPGIAKLVKMADAALQKR